jgi:hypothetical protein
MSECMLRQLASTNSVFEDAARFKCRWAQRKLIWSSYFAIILIRGSEFGMVTLVGAVWFADYSRIIDSHCGGLTCLPSAFSCSSRMTLSMNVKKSGVWTEAAKHLFFKFLQTDVTVALLMGHPNNKEVSNHCSLKAGSFVLILWTNSCNEEQQSPVSTNELFINLIAIA